MDKEIKISIILSIVFLLISTVVVFSVLYLNYEKQIDTESSIIEKASEQSVYNFASSHASIKELETNLTAYKLSNTEILHTYLLSIINDNEAVACINIITPINGSNENLFVLESTDENNVGKVSNQYNIYSFNTGHTFYITDKEDPIITIISPINISGKTVGTKEIVISMEKLDLSHSQEFRSMIINGIICIIILFTVFLIMLRAVIIEFK